MRLKSMLRVTQFKAQARSKGRTIEEDPESLLNEEEERDLLDNVSVKCAKGM